MALGKRLAQRGLFYVMAAFISALIVNVGVALKLMDSNLNFFQQVGLFLTSFIVSAVIVWLAVRKSGE